MRKLALGIVFLLCGTFVAWAGIRQGSDLIGLATVIGAIAIGVGTIVWGNAQEWKAKKGNGEQKVPVAGEVKS